MSNSDQHGDLDDALLAASDLDHEAVPDTTTEPMAEPAAGSQPAAARIGRRGMMAGLTLGGVSVAAGAAGAVLMTSTTAAGGGYRREQFTVDIACLGPTWREAARNYNGVTPDPSETGSAFITEGWVYPGGTIPEGDGFAPVEKGSIGRWFCHGWFVLSKSRWEPHLNSGVDLVFGSLTPEQPFPPDTLSIVGNEGTDDRSRSALRAVIGGTGKYVGAAGQIHQRYLGLNSSLMWDGGFSPSFRYEVDIRVWS